ncbi:MAG: hypothetical protein JRE40_04030 [Deltaproteobacteria bacterium]|nr:hypothetical protein [Deltaproteobacteria bacterium]
MPVDPGAAADALADKARAIWWVFTNPLFWAAVIYSFFHSARYEREMREKDIEEWQKLNGRGE